jgi:hypothetical protein
MLEDDRSKILSVLRLGGERCGQRGVFENVIGDTAAAYR